MGVKHFHALRAKKCCDGRFTTDLSPAANAVGIFKRTLMFDFPKDPTALHHFVLDNAESLQHAAITLGGDDWLRRTRRIIDDLRLGKPLTRRTRIEVEKLYGLLTLRYAADPNTAEFGFAADLDPASPIVEEICLLADHLEDVAHQVGLNLQDPWEGDLMDRGHIA